MNASYLKPVMYLVAMAVATSGCAFIDGQVDLVYRPAAEKKSSLSTIKPLAIRVSVHDQRETVDKALVGNRKNGFGAVIASMKTDQNLALVLRQALIGELENNGHTAVQDRETSFDAMLDVSLKKYWAESTVRFFDVQVLGTLSADIRILDLLDQQITMRGITGTHVESRQLAVDEAFQDVLNGALAEFVRNFARDPIIIKALRGLNSIGVNP